MSLYVCENCDGIENTACCDRNIDSDPLYPNMHLMDMQGMGEETFNVTKLKVDTSIPRVVCPAEFKEPYEVMMLCSECNTGVWHGEFPKEIATEEEKELAGYSKFNMITPTEQEDGCIQKDENARMGYSLNQTYKHLHERFRHFTGSSKTMHISRHPSRFKLFYYVWKEDPMNFIHTDYHDIKLEDEYDVELSILDSQIYPDKSKSTIYHAVAAKHGVSNFHNDDSYILSRGIDTVTTAYLANILSLIKKKRIASHWKDIQPEDQKARALKKAELKREIKSRKKALPKQLSSLDRYNLELKIKELEKEYKEL